MAEASSPPATSHAPVLFITDELLADEQLEPSARSILNKIEQRRKAYRKAIPEIVASIPNQRAQEKWKKFDAGYTETARKLDEPLAARDRSGALEVIIQLERAFLDFEDEVKDDVLAGPWGFSTQQAANYVANKLRDELTAQFADQVQQIRTAAEQLLAVKTAGEASSSFDSHIKALARASAWGATAWLMALLVAWTAGLFAEGYVLWTVHKEGDAHLTFAAGGIVAAAVVFLLYFVHGQYKIAKMMAIKYEHMKGLVGGGAVNLIGMLGGQDEFRKRVLERLAESFMSLDDITGALNRLRTPAEDAVEGLKEATKTLVAAKKATE